jgi:hypothetical protein
MALVQSIDRFLGPSVFTDVFINVTSARLKVIGLSGVLD